LKSPLDLQRSKTDPEIQDHNKSMAKTTKKNESPPEDKELSPEKGLLSVNDKNGEISHMRRKSEGDKGSPGNSHKPSKSLDGSNHLLDVVSHCC
jgi:hypothetical protein